MAANDHLSADVHGDVQDPVGFAARPDLSGAEGEPVNDPSESPGEAGESNEMTGVREESGEVRASGAEAAPEPGAESSESSGQSEPSPSGEPASAPSEASAAASEDAGPEQAEAAAPADESGDVNASGPVSRYESESVSGAEPEQEPAPEVPRAPAVPEHIRKRHHVAPAMIALERVLDDETFRIRPEGDLSLLATDIARLGQLFPVDLRLVPPDKFQIISGFRRVAALRFLQRDKVLARLHTDIDDDDALLMALAAAIHSVPVQPDELSGLKERLDREGRLSAAARDMLEKALSVGEELAPESTEVEIDADELALDVTARLGAINQDLALLADVFASLDEARRAELLDQLRYSADLVTFLEGKS